MSEVFIQTFFLNFPLMWHSLLTPSKHIASNRPFPSILITWAYSCPSSLNTNSLFPDSFSFLPLHLFLPPLPLFFSMMVRATTTVEVRDSLLTLPATPLQEERMGSRKCLTVVDWKQLCSGWSFLVNCQYRRPTGSRKCFRVLASAKVTKCSRSPLPSQPREQPHTLIFRKRLTGSI